MLALPETATEEQALASLRLLKERADQAETIFPAGGGYVSRGRSHRRKAYSEQRTATTLSPWASQPGCRT